VRANPRFYYLSLSLSLSLSPGVDRASEGNSRHELRAKSGTRCCRCCSFFSCLRVLEARAFSLLSIHLAIVFAVPGSSLPRPPRPSPVSLSRSRCLPFPVQAIRAVVLPWTNDREPIAGMKSGFNGKSSHEGL
jgi:hypothetical protein